MSTNTSVTDLLIRLILEFEFEKNSKEISNICSELKEFSRMGNIREMDLTYQKLREYVKKHKQLIRELRDNETNQ